MKALVWFAVIAMSLFPSFASAAGAEDMKKFYLKKLDTWVETGGNISTVQDELVTNCGKLVMVNYGVLKSAKSMFSREELDQDVDVCVKITVHRVYPQPEFSNPKIIDIICHSNNEFYNVLCKKANIK